MNPAQIIHFTREAMILVLVLSLPPIVVASVVGVGLSLLQAITQVQEQTLTFAVKLLCVMITLVVSAAWLGREIILFATMAFSNASWGALGG